MSDIDNMDDFNIDDFDDLPELVIPPAGTHKFSVTLKEADNDDPKKRIVRATFAYKETLELANENDAEKLPKPDDICTVNYDLKHEYGGPAFKKDFSGVCKELGVSSLASILEGVKGVDVIATTKIRISKNKEDPKNPYKNLQIVSMQLDN